MGSISLTVGLLPTGGAMGPHFHHWSVLHAAPDSQNGLHASTVDYHMLYHSQNALVRGISSIVEVLPTGGTMGPYCHHWPVLHAAPDSQNGGHGGGHYAGGR